MRGCGSPYLEWAHFDPPWSEREHHDPNGMIALCAEHHAKIDGGALTREQIRELKGDASNRKIEIAGRFDWLRRDLLGVVGGNFFLDTSVVLRLHGQPVIWFTRDEGGHVLVNVKMQTTSGEPRAEIEENYWISRGTPLDLECPPSGKHLRICYANGDDLQIDFLELNDEEQARSRYSHTGFTRWPLLSFPITAVEITHTIAGTGISLGPDSTSIGGLYAKGNLARNVGVMFDVG